MIISIDFTPVILMVLAMIGLALLPFMYRAQGSRFWTVRFAIRYAIYLLSIYTVNIVLSVVRVNLFFDQNFLLDKVVYFAAIVVVLLLWLFRKR